MKKSDIVVGTEYAFGRQYEYEQGNASRGKVVGWGEITVGRAWQNKTQAAPMVEITNRDGSVRSAQPLLTRDLREEWDSYNEHWTEIRAARRKSANARANAQHQRAQMLDQIIGLFEAAGIKDEKGYVYNAVQKARLLEVIPERFDRDEEGEATSNFNGPLARNYDGYVTDGKGFTLSYDDILKIASIDR